MKISTSKLLSIMALITLLGTFSCGGDDDEVTPATNEAPGSFSTTVNDITSSSASIEWSPSVDPDGDAISYDITLLGQILESNFTATSVSITGLDASTDYNGAIIAKDGNGGSTESTFNFTTESGSSGISDADCPNDNSTNTIDIGCSTDPTVANQYSESVSGDIRTVTTNTYPNHKFSTRSPDVFVTVFDRTYTMDATPSIASSTTSILNPENLPRYYHGVALNGIPLDPAPAEPFIFENTSTGEYNWDWIFEPNNNKTDVSLDCATAHVGPFGYHYHGDMAEYAEILSVGISGGTTPSEAVQIGWASDGFPVLYKYGPDASDNLKLLQPSYKLKDGLRPGDGVSEPCGSYSGKYTDDYEYVDGLGDLDECNGVERSITLTTANGTETFSYFYVITDDFPVMSRCMVGTPDESFAK